MAIDINNNILEIEKTATTDADYTGKKIVELPDTVIMKNIYTIKIN